MPRLTNRLTAKAINHLSRPGWYADGLGLYLQISNSGSKSWVYRYTHNRKQHWHGLGSVSQTNSLKVARVNAEKCRQLRREGVDPITAKREAQRAQTLQDARALTFDTCANRYIDSHKNGWRNRKHEAQWRNTLTTYASPILGNQPVQAIDTEMVLRVIEPIWIDKTETANRVRQRIEVILDWAKALGYREGDNPAAWRGHLDKVMAHPTKIRPVRHHAALPYSQVPALFRQLHQIDSIASLALQFTILTAARSGESRNAAWTEIDLNQAVWEIPPNRMKNHKSHRVPLSPEAVAILNRCEARQSHFVFTGNRDGQAITEAAARKLLKSHAPTITLHGFRSSFRDWCSESSFPRELAEKALAHAAPSQTEAAYQRSDLFEHRRVLMSEWATFCRSDHRAELAIVK